MGSFAGAAGDVAAVSDFFSIQDAKVTSYLEHFSARNPRLSIEACLFGAHEARLPAALLVLQGIGSKGDVRHPWRSYLENLQQTSARFGCTWNVASYKDVLHYNTNTHYI